MAGSFDEEYNALSGRIGVIYDVAQAKGATAPMPAADQRNTYNLSGYVDSIQTSTPQPIDAFVEWINSDDATITTGENAYIDLDIPLSTLHDNADCGLSTTIVFDHDLSGTGEGQDGYKSTRFFGYGTSITIGCSMWLRPTQSSGSLSALYVYSAGQPTINNASYYAYAPVIHKEEIAELSGFTYNNKPQFTATIEHDNSTANALRVFVGDKMRSQANANLNFNYYPVVETGTATGNLQGRTVQQYQRLFFNWKSAISPCLFCYVYSSTTGSTITRNYCYNPHIHIYGMDITFKHNIGVIHRHLLPARKGTTYGLFDIVSKRFFTKSNQLGHIGGGQDVYVI